MASDVRNETEEEEHYVPEFAKPYPKPGWGKITDFEYKSPLVLYRSIEAVQCRGDKKDADYIVALPYTVNFKLDGRACSLTVPKGMLTDLASVWFLARPIIGRVGPHLEAAIVHDFLYIAWQNVEGHSANKDDRKFADELMYKAMEKAKVGRIKRDLIYGALRGLGWIAYNKQDKPPLYHQLPDDALDAPASQPLGPEPTAEKPVHAP